jgi:hypothetical protein
VGSRPEAKHSGSSSRHRFGCWIGHSKEIRRGEKDDGRIVRDKFKNVIEKSRGKQFLTVGIPIERRIAEYEPHFIEWFRSCKEIFPPLDFEGDGSCLPTPCSGEIAAACAGIKNYPRPVLGPNQVEEEPADARWGRDVILLRIRRVAARKERSPVPSSCWIPFSVFPLDFFEGVNLTPCCALIVAEGRKRSI